MSAVASGRAYQSVNDFQSKGWTESSAQEETRVFCWTDLTLRHDRSER